MSDYQWKVTPDNEKTVTFDDYVQDFHYIYQTTDEQRDVTDVLLNLISNTSRVSESVRRKLYWKLPSDLADVIAWLLSFAAKLGSDLEDTDRIFSFKFCMTDAVWNKYPGLCPVCFSRKVQENEHYGNVIKLRLLSDKEIHEILETFGLPGGPFQNCTCLSSLEDPERRNELDSKAKRLLNKNMEKLRLEYAKKRRQAYEPKGYVSYYEDMFFKIYGANIRSTSFEDIVFHLQEEVGEVSEALTQLYTFNTNDHALPDTKLRDERTNHLCEECADVISWIFALILKVRFMLRDAQASATAVSQKSAKASKKKVGVKDLESQELTFFSIVWSKYGGDKHLRCGDICKQDICECPWYIARKRDQVDAILSR